MPPTNWESKFGGSAWEYVEKFDEYYLHLFDVSQPDLNWENPEVRKEVQNVIKFWMGKGIKGFRFDVVNLISKDKYENDYEGDGRRFYTDGPNIHKYLRELNEAPSEQTQRSLLWEKCPAPPWKTAISMPMRMERNCPWSSASTI